MEDARNQENAKIDWTKKGRGWLPDYPDFRDYALNHEDINKDGRLRRENTTGEIEDLATNVINILTSFKKEFGKFLQINDEGIESKINDLTNQAYGKIYLANLKIYKLFRKRRRDKYEQSKEKADRKTLNNFFFSNQIFELKTYLSFLILNNELKSPTLKLHSSDIDFKKPDEIAKWLRTNDFDLTTYHLVRLFQKQVNIHEDGIVGFETYTALNEYFSNAEKNKKLKKSKVETCQEVYGYPLLKVKLPVIPIPLPLAIFTAILKELKLMALEQIELELSVVASEEDEIPLQDRSLKSISEVDFLEKIECRESTVFEDVLKESFDKHFDGPSNSLPHSSRNKRNAVDFWNNLMNELTTENFTNLFYSEFYTFEPIISMVFKTVAPLSSHKNQSIAEVVDLGFQRFRMLLQPKRLQLPSQDSEKAFKSNFKHDYDELKHLIDQAEQALKKVLQSFNLAVELIIEDKILQEDQHERKQTLLFYLLLKKYLNRLDCLKAQVDETQTPKEIIYRVKLEQVEIAPKYYEANLFDKQEFFNIQLDPKSSNSNTELPQELFQPAELNIPVSDAFIDLKCLKSLDPKSQQPNGDKKPYFFLPGFVDLSFWCPKIGDQGSLNSCTAFAGTALFEYFVNRSSNEYDDMSPLFLYKTARQLVDVWEDTGASVRDTMKAMALFGIPPADSWPYQVEKVDEEPPPFCYAYAKNFEALKYFRLDYAGIAKDILLFEIKAILTAGFPCMFGFTLYTSALEEPNPQRGYIPYPDEKTDKVVDGHAVVAVGYDDNKFINHANPEEEPTRGAILIRNSWGLDWGNQGYGWLPYEYVLSGLTSAWWSLLKADWFQRDNFGLGGKGGDGPDNNSGQKGPPPPPPGKEGKQP